MLRIVLLTTAALMLTAGLVPASSQADVAVYLNDGEDATDTLLAKFRTASCRRSTRRGAGLKFTATARPLERFGSGHKLEVDLFTRGRSHDLAYGGPNQFTYTGPAGRWSNLEVPPNAPPGGGGVQFNSTMTRMGLAFSPAFSSSGSEYTVSVTGGLRCKYPKRRRR